jgi:hypothetical protein
MFQAPACIDWLEDRVLTNVEYFKGHGKRSFWVVVKGYPIAGWGKSFEDAVRDFCKENKIDY